MNALLLLLASCASAQTTITGDAWISGRLGVGTTSPAAVVDVVNGSTTTSAFQVSGVDATPFLQVASSGAVGIGIAPAANLDVYSQGDADAVGVQIHNGKNPGGSSAFQLAFGVNGSADLRHAISTTHSTTTSGGSMDFFIWTPSVSTTAAPSLNLLSLVTTTNTASVHIMPAQTPFVELEVSSGSTLGGGAVHRALEGTHSSRDLKTDISYLTEADERAAFEEVKDLRHARFRYKRLKKGKLVRDRKQPLMRGLIYEDVPESIRAPDHSISYDRRLLNEEMATQELIRRLDRLDAEVPK